MDKYKTFQAKLSERFCTYESRTAVEYGDRFVTYSELDRRTGDIARWLKGQEIEKGTFIAVMIEDRIEMISAVIAILKARCVFVPIDTGSPADRLEKISNLTGINKIFVDETNFKKINNDNFIKTRDVELICIDKLCSAAPGKYRHLEGIDTIYQPEDKIYIYFTSGSRGVPRAVVGKNKSLLHYIEWEVDTFEIDGGFRICQFSNPGFDAFLKEVFVTFFAGGTLCVPESFKMILNTDDLIEWIEKHRIHLIHCVPSVFRVFNSQRLTKEHFLNLKYILLSGEMIYPVELKNWFDKFDERIQLVNLYGTTETTILKTYYLIKKTDVYKKTIPIGRPIKGTRIIILDKNMNVCDEKVIGEIYIRTPYMSYGYYNDEELNKQIFIQNPFSDKPGDIINKTGDLGRFLPDGNIEFLGRNDRQVKIRGIRVELGEIENALLEYKTNSLQETIPQDNEEFYCKNCMLPASYPGIHFNEEGICNICREYERYKELTSKYFLDIESFARLMEEARKGNDSEYDCLLLYSGGKDSSYVLYRLVDMGFKVLTFTFDNGFISQAAFRNIQDTTSRLNVENIVCRLDNMSDVFVESLLTDFTVCSGCFKALTTMSTRIAYERGINVVITGLSRGQIFETKLEQLFREKIFEPGEIERKLLLFRRGYHSLDDRVARLIDIKLDRDEFERIYFVDFFRYADPTIQEIKEYLRSKGWSNPENTGFCSTNCVINDVGIYIHKKYKGYHNYAAPLSWDYRLGLISRKEGLKALEFSGDVTQISKILDEIGYYKSQITNLVVVENKDDGLNNFLCVYFTAERRIPASELREYLKTKLPDSVVPSYFIQLEKMPLTPNGKIDIKLLPKPGTTISATEFAPPRDETEERLARLWSETLKIDKTCIGINTNFFELGGDSLSCLTIISRIHKDFDIRLSIEMVFNNSTIRKQGELIKRADMDRFRALNPLEKRECYSMSSAQKRLYILWQLEPDSIGYNNTQVFVLEGQIKRKRIEDVFRKMIGRHESFRTSFRMIEEKPVQIVHDEVDFSMDYYDLKSECAPDGVASKENNRNIQEKIKEFVHPFDLAQAPLLRVFLLKCSEKKHVFTMDLHHIISDGTSALIFIEELAILYSGGELPGLRIQYKDFSHWQNSENKQELVKKQERYWLQEFSDESPVLNLPADFERPLLQSFSGEKIDFTLGKEETSGLKSLALKENATLHMLLLALYNVLLAKLGGNEDIVVGTPIAGRNHIDLQNIIGMFVNTLALRNFPRPDKTFKDFLGQVRQRTLKAFENQEYQFEELVEKVPVTRDTGRNPLFDAVLVLQNMEIQTYEIAKSGISELEILPYNHEYRTAKFDITLAAQEVVEEILFTFEYCTKLFKSDTIRKFIKYFKRIVSGVLQNHELKLSDIEILSEEEKSRLLYLYNDTEADYPGDKFIHEIFEEQAEKTPDSTALVSEDGRLTYDELSRRSNQLAALLGRKAVKTDKIVGIMVERSFDMIVGIVGIMKAGGAYLPIDPRYPPDRAAYILEDSGSEVLLTQKRIANKQRLTTEQVFIEGKEIYEGNHSNPVRISTASPSNLAYVIYTSGSTGNPKGVMIAHKSIRNTLFALQQKYPFKRRDVYLLKTSYMFDVSVAELFGWFFCGGQLAILEKDGEKDPLKIMDAMERHCITHINFIPSMFNVFIDFLDEENTGKLTTLKYIFLAGEALYPSVVDKFKQRMETTNPGIQPGREWERPPHPWVRLENIYGPTEASIYGSWYSLSRWQGGGSIPIGTPLYNVGLYIIDQSRNLQPIDVTGELCIAGEGLARGYLNNIELTREKFVNDPFQPHGRMYRTGDLARWNSEGNIEFLGRLDHQVKVRGFRVELEDIESHLLHHEHIREAVVLPGQDEAGGRYLCAYIASEVELSAGGLTEYLKQSLPGYMIPSYFIQVEKLPVTHNGKLDRKSLPKPGDNMPADEKEYIAPRNQVEVKLAGTWQQVLGKEKIGIKDNFFMIGGDSIKAILIVSNLRKIGYAVEMSDIFLYPTISELSPYVKELKRTADQSVITGIVPLTPIQIHFFKQKVRYPHHYNQSVMLYSREGFEYDAIEAVLRKVQERHDALRMTFKKERGRIIQINNGLELPVALQVFDLRNKTDSLSLIEEKANEIQAGINLGKGPLMQSGLFKSDDGDRLLIVIHHLIIDGVSWRILFEDIDTLTKQYRKGKPLELPLKSDSFKLWSERLSGYAQSKVFLKEKAYWSKLAAARVKQVGKDFPGSNNFEDVDSLSFVLSEEDTGNLLTAVNHAFGTEINDIILTGLGLGIRDTFGYDKLLLALEGHGREEIIKDLDTTRTVGWFTSIYPVILDVSYENNLSRQIKEVKETLHQIPSKGIGYGILKYLVSRENQSNIGFKLKPRISFNYLGQFDADIEQKSFTINRDLQGNSVSYKNRRDFELDISGMIANKRLVISVSYSRKQYKNETIRVLLDNYKNRLRHIISYCSGLEGRELTPCDLTYKEISIEHLDKLTGQYVVEDIYRLSPMQEGILFHSLYNKNSSAYFEQLSYRLKGELDVKIIHKSLNELMKRYDILRTLIIHEGLSRPIQLVLKNREIGFVYKDIREMSGLEKKELYLKEFKLKDRQLSFDLQNDALMRVAIFRLAEEEYELVWSYHHILMDGWCMGIIINDFFEIYDSYLTGRPYQLPGVKPYRIYLEWLESQDNEVSKEYWREYLAGYEEMVSLPRKNSSGRQVGDYKNERVSFFVDSSQTISLNEISGRNNVTLSTVLQTIWGILLGKYTGKEDVVFGTVVSGRPPEIEGVGSMVGLFINTIPVRIKFEEDMSFRELQQTVQKKAITSEKHHYCSLADIQSVSNLKQHLLDHILVFENFPLAKQIEGTVNIGGKNNKKSTGFELTGIETFEQSNYDLNVLIASYGKRLSIIFDFNGNTYEKELMQRIAGHFRTIVDQLIENEAIKIKEFEFSLPFIAARSSLHQEDVNEWEL